MDEHVYKLRVDTDSVSWCQAFVDKYCDQYLFCMEKEATTNQHCHFYIQKRTDVSEVSIRKYIQRTIGSGNGAYSLKKLAGILPVEYCSYCIKDQRSDSTIYHNLGDSYIKLLRERNAEVKQEMKEKKQAKRTQYQLVMDCYREMWEKELVKFDETDRPNPQAESVALWLIEYYLAKDQQIRKSTIESLTLTIMCKFHNYGKYLASDIARFMNTEYRPEIRMHRLPPWSNQIENDEKQISDV